jgi:predicted phage tail protein
VLDPDTGIAVGVDAAGSGATQLTMTGLSNGVPYTFWVRAVNAAGASEFSALSNVVTPGAPTGPAGTPTTTPTGSPTTTPTGSPTTTPTGSPTTTPTGGPTPIPTTPTPSGTTPAPGGTTPAPGGTTPAPGGTTAPDGGTTDPAPSDPHAPGAPRIDSVTAGNALAVVRWTAPASNGGSPIVRYEVEVLSASKNTRVGNIRTASANAYQLTVTGLTNGTAYRFRVRAVNAIGTGPQSASSAAVTPRTVASAPANVTAQPGPAGGKATATIRWTTPSSSGGSAITRYRVTWQRLDAKGIATGAPAAMTLAAGTRSATYTAPAGVRSGTRYRVTVQAINGVGTGPGRAVFTYVR